MRVLGIVDIHSKIDRLDDILAEAEDAELVLIAGDITNFGVDDKAKEVLEPLLDVSKALFAVSGNCDYGEVDRYLKEKDLHLENTPREYQGFSLIGVGGSLPCPSRTPHEHTEEEFAQLLNQQTENCNLENPLIAVIHQPPINTTIDKSLLAGHVGSESVRSFVEKFQPVLFFSGHIHESAGLDTIGATTLINPGPFLKGWYFTGELDKDNVEIEIKRL